MLGLVISVGITILITHRLGATDQADAFIMARRLVTSLTELLHRAIPMIFIPMLAAELFFDRARRQNKLVKWSWRFLGASAALVTIFWFCTPAVVGSLGSEMSEETRALAVLCTRIMLLSIPAVVLANIYTAGLYLNGIYGVPSVLKQLPRLLVFLVFAFAGTALLVETASIAFALGSYLLATGCAYLIWRRSQLAGSPKKKTTDAKPGANFGVVLLMMAGPQVVSWMEVYFAVKLGEGALTVLELSQRTATVIGAALIASAVMPRLAEWSLSAANRTPHSFVRALWVGILLLVCAQSFFLLNAREVVDLLYSKSQLTTKTLEEMTSTIIIMSISPLMVYLYQIVAVWNIACGRRGLVWTILVAIAVNLATRGALAAGLLPTLGLHALALGMIFGPGAAALVLIVLGERGYWPDRAPGRIAWLTLLATVLALAGMAAGQKVALALAPNISVVPNSAFSLSLSALLGGAAFAACAWRFRLLNYLRM